MNILWLSHLIPYPPKGGVKQRSFNLMKEISRYHNLFIICFSQKSHQPTQKAREDALAGLSSVGQIVADFSFASDRSGFAKSILAIRSLITRDPYTVNWLKKRGLGSVIRNTIDKQGIDLVHFDTISWATYLNYAEGCKTVLNHHNIESHMMLRRAENERNFIRKLYFRQEGRKLSAYENHVCGQFDLNITCSTVDTIRLSKRFPHLHIDTIPNGVDLTYFHPLGLGQEPNSMVFAGGLSWYPNIAAMRFFVTQVWPGLAKKVPDARMTLIGRNPPRWLTEFAGRTANFTVTGFVDDVRPHLDRAAVYVCPITDGGGTRLKVLDALAMGKAIVAHPIACEGIDVEDGENVLYAETPGDYISKIRLLFDNESLRIKLGTNGRKLIEEKYDYTVIGKNLDFLYSKL